MAGAPWVKVWWSWYTSRSHIGLSGVALALGPALMLLGRESHDRHNARHNERHSDARSDGESDGPGDCASDVVWLRDAQDRPITAQVVASIVRFDVPSVQGAFGELVACGTLVVSSEGVYGFPKFVRYQETPSAQRMRKLRGSGRRHSDAHSDAHSDGSGDDKREEGRGKREEKKNPPIPPVGGVRVLDLPDLDREAIRPSAGGAYLAEVREAWAEAWHAAGAGTPPRLAPALMAGAVAFARDVATTHKLPLRDAARAVAEAALRAGGDPTWHLTRLDPFAAPRPLPGAGNGMPLADQIQAAEKALREAGVRDAPMSELQPLADRVKKLKAQRDEREDQARRYARR